MSIYVAYLVILVRLSSLVALKDGIVLSVTRQVTGDAYTITHNNSHVQRICRDLTLLVNERRCVENEELFYDCSFAIAVAKEPSSYRLTLSIDRPSDTEITTAAIFTSLNNLTESDAVIITKQINQTISNQYCQIASLEVYRGKKQSIMINCCGFLLSDMGGIEINLTRLSYSFEEYLGELYRMNLSCSGLGLPNSGCLFFKIGGMANITKSKFDSAIQGSLESKVTTLPMTLSTYQMTTAKITTNSTTVHSDSPTSTVHETTLAIYPSFGSNILVVVSLVGGTTIILTISIVMVCVVVWFKNRRKRQLNSISNQPQIQDAAVTLQPSMCQRNPAYIQLGPVKSSQTALVSGSYSENPAYNIDVQQSSHQEPTYEVIPSHTDGTPHITQGIQNIIYNQNPAYIHLSIHAEESASVQADPMSPADYSQNPAYGLWHFKS